MSVSNLNFNWSLLDRNGLVQYLWSLWPSIVDTPLTAAQMNSVLSKHIKKQLPVRVCKKLDPTVDFGWVYVGGCYYSDYDEDYEKCIEVSFHYNPFDKKVCLDRARFRRVCLAFSDVILHEMIHMRQYRRREFKFLPDYESKAELAIQRAEQGYLGCSDEIDAYSFNLACELLERFKNDPVQACKYLGKKHTRGRLRSHTLRMYLKAFDYNHNHPIVRRLKQRAIRYMDNASTIGRPYRTADWINW